VLGLAVPPAQADDSGFLPRPGLELLQSDAPQAIDPRVAMPASEPKSIGKAAALSALLPGLGEAYSGHTTRAIISGSAEAAIWISYATFKVQEDLRADRAIEYAVQNASALDNGDDDYYKAMSQYARAEGPGQWNEYVRRTERDAGEEVGREYTGNEAWAWNSEQHLLQYRTLRRESLHAGDHATNALAFLLVNRIISVVSVVQAVRSDHHKAEKQLGLRFESGGSFHQPEARLGLWNRF
jgi:hypothetical protein